MRLASGPRGCVSLLDPAGAFRLLSASRPPYSPEWCPQGAHSASSHADHAEIWQSIGHSTWHHISVRPGLVCGSQCLHRGRERKKGHGVKRKKNTTDGSDDRSIRTSACGGRAGDRRRRDGRKLFTANRRRSRRCGRTRRSASARPRRSSTRPAAGTSSTRTPATGSRSRTGSPAATRPRCSPSTTRSADAIKRTRHRRSKRTRLGRDKAQHG